MKRVFISLPMAGIPSDVIQLNIDRAKSWYHKNITRKESPTDYNVQYVENSKCQAPVETIKNGYSDNLWYLGHAIGKLGACDEIIFCPGWQNSRGCQVEFFVAERYGIKMHEMEEQK